MSENLATLLPRLSYRQAKPFLQQQVAYIKTTPLDPVKPIVEMRFHSTLQMAINEMDCNVNLRPVDPYKEVTALLRLLDEHRDDLLLSQVEFILIGKGGLDLVRIENTAKPKSGTFAYMDINAMRQELSTMIPSGWFHQDTSLILFLSVVSTVAIGFASSYLFGRSKSR